MKRLPVLVLALLVAAACVRLGFWQLSRLDEKQVLNAQLALALAAEPRGPEAADSLAEAGSEALRRGRFTLSGRYDETRQFLLMGRARNGDPGVGVVTPLLPAGGGPAVLVDRGWIPSYDAATAQPERYPAPGERTVTGLAEPLARGGKGARRTRYFRVEIDSLEVWSTPRLDPDSVAALLPYQVRPWVLRALPDAADSLEVLQAARTSPFAGPLRARPRPFDEGMHRSYAGQWFAFAAITLIGSIVLVLRGGRANPATGSGGG